MRQPPPDLQLLPPLPWSYRSEHLSNISGSSTNQLSTPPPNLMSDCHTLDLQSETLASGLSGLAWFLSPSDFPGTCPQHAEHLREAAGIRCWFLVGLPCLGFLWLAPLRPAIVEGWLGLIDLATQHGVSVHLWSYCSFRCIFLF